MIVRGIDGDNDWLFGKGRNDYQSANNAIGQSIKTRLQSFLGDCFFATDAGLDWFSLLGAKDRLALELAVRSAILNTTGVTRIIDVTITLSTNRNIIMQYTVETIFTGGNPNEVVTAKGAFILTESGDILTTEDGSGLEGG